MSAPLTFKKKNPKVVISTKFGNITIQFYTDVASRHVDSFLSLAKIGFYNGTAFHRVVPGFIIQGGDPLSKEPDRSLHGTGGPGFSLTPEPSDQPHRRGTVSMAKMPGTTIEPVTSTTMGHSFLSAWKIRAAWTGPIPSSEKSGKAWRWWIRSWQWNGTPRTIHWKP